MQLVLPCIGATEVSTIHAQHGLARFRIEEAPFEVYLEVNPLARREHIPIQRLARRPKRGQAEDEAYDETTKRRYY